MLIYMAINITNNKKYIGKTKFSLNKRKIQHKNNANCNRPGHFYNAIRKYGFEVFDWFILEEDVETNELLNELEYHYIVQYNSINEGYNITPGGEGLSNAKGLKLEDIFGKEKAREIKQKEVENNAQYWLGKERPDHSERMSGDNHPKPFLNKFHSEDTKEKISQSTKNNNNPMYGVSRSKDVKEKISSSLSGRKRPDISRAKKGKKNPNNSGKKHPNWGRPSEEQPMYNKKHSEETKNKMRGKKKKQEILECPHCKKQGGASNMKRHHFENCKFKKEGTYYE